MTTAYCVITAAPGVLGGLAGLYAARCWCDASTGKIDSLVRVESGETEQAQADQIAGIMNSVVESANLNKKAALWTAAAVLLGSVSSILSLVACLH